MSILEVPGTDARVRLKCLQCFVPMRGDAVRLVTGLWAEKSSKFAITSRRAESVLKLVVRRFLAAPVLVPDGSASGVAADVWLSKKFPIDDADAPTEEVDGTCTFACYVESAHRERELLQRNGHVAPEPRAVGQRCGCCVTSSKATNQRCCWRVCAQRSMRCCSITQTRHLDSNGHVGLSTEQRHRCASARLVPVQIM